MSNLDLDRTPYRSVFDASHDAMVLVEADSGRIVEANATACELFGCRREELLGLTVADLRTPGEREEAERIFRRDPPPDRIRLTSTYRTREGKSFVGQVVASRLAIDGSEYFHGLVRDVTEQRGTEQRYRTLVERSPAGVTIVTPEGRVLEANRAAAEILGFDSVEQLRGRSVVELHRHPANREAFLKQLADDGEVRNYELPLRRPDGEEITILLNAVKAHDPAYDSEVLLETWVDVSERREMARELERQAHHDDLTGLVNRRALYERAEQILALCERQDRNAALIYLDLVGFKQVNEELGHRGGDRVLREVGTRLSETVRDSDIACRIGGDEFVVLAAMVGDEDAAIQAGRRMLYCFDDPVEVEDREVHLRPAAGLALYPRDGLDLDTLLDRADRALWGVERKKGPGLRVYRPELEMQVPEALQLRDELKTAIQTGFDEFRVHYQPVVDAASGRLRGLEALIRWEHPERGLLPAAEFVPVAEAAGLIGEMDRWTFREAARQALAWSEEGRGPDWLSLNLSAQTLGDPELQAFVEESLPADIADASTQLVVEITEHAAMRREQVVRSVLAVMDRKLGLSVSIDDFGTGYSSLLYLRRFPADYLKIDMEFVSGIGLERADEKVIRAIIALGAEFGMELIAEGIETDAQRDWLREAGCQHLQGYLFGHPMPPEELDFGGS